jgi:NodT family efflux transporter outer membrane factor (OMF) lipoprotein
MLGIKKPTRHRLVDLNRAGAAPAIAGAVAALVGAAGCVSGPDFHPPAAAAPVRWEDWHGGDATLALANAGREGFWAHDFWGAFNDPELPLLLERARAANPDLQLAMLHLAQARVEETMVTAQRGIQVNAAVDAARRRDSEFGADTRLVDVLAGARTASIVKTLGEPYSLYRPGFDASWELDLWGRQRRAEESSHAGTLEQAASLRQSQSSVAADVARGYFTMRSQQRQERLLRTEIAIAEDRIRLLSAQQVGGLIDESAVLRERQQVEDLEALAPQLAGREAQAINQITRLLGARPGDLNAELAPPATLELEPALPDLNAGLPSEFARRRPDIVAAEARLRGATANVGVAVADLYPSITLGASFGIESVGTAKVGNWGARDWSLGPNLDIPVFDHGRRRATIRLRGLQQQEAAVAYQQTVLRAWHEVDDAISAYQADGQQCAALAEKVGRTAAEAGLAEARAANGATSVLPNLEAQGAHTRARRALAECASQRAIALVALYKALGGDGQAPASASLTRGGVIGSRNSRAPVASNTALAMAAPVATTGGSPQPWGASASLLTNTTSMRGTQENRGSE